MSTLVGELIARIAADGTPERALQEKKYLKSDLEHLGATVPACRIIAKEFAKRPEIQADVWPFIAACWAENVYELRSTCGFILEHVPVVPADRLAVEAMLRNAHTWAIIDQVATRIVPRLELAESELLRWAQDDDFWIRRTSLLEPLVALRGGLEPSAWAKRANINLADPQFFIRKAIGWVLREIGKKQPDWTANYCIANRDKMSSLTWREATRNLPEGLIP